MKIKIIDLLNKISNNEQPPKKIAFKEYVYNYNEEVKDYYNEIEDYLFDTYVITDILNDEVEILEITITMNNQDNKIEKLEIVQEKNCKNNWKWKLNGYNISTPQKIMGDKINEIIDRWNNER